MLPKELFKKIRHIEITTSRLVTNVFAGEYHSVFKGRGMEFSEVREYDTSDDIRDIDWNVTARVGSPFTKKFVEERELTVMLLVDASSSGQFGTQGKTKSDTIAEIAGLLAFSAIKNNDRVGLLIFTDRVEKFIPPKKGKTHVLRVIREILSFQPTHRRTNINAALQMLNDVVKKRSTVFLFSDFYAEDFSKLLRITHRKHDVVSIVMEDPIESVFPKLGYLELEDAETGELFSFRPKSKKFLEAFQEKAKERSESLKRLFASMDLDHIRIMTNQSYIQPLIRFFKMRERRFH